MSFSPGRDDISQYNKSPFLKRRSSLKSGMARPANVPRRRAFSKWLARHSIASFFGVRPKNRKTPQADEDGMGKWLV